jgi:copper chaperone
LYLVVPFTNVVGGEVGVRSGKKSFSTRPTIHVRERAEKRSTAYNHHANPFRAANPNGATLFRQHPLEALQVKFSVKNELRPDAVSTLAHAMKMVDSDAKVDVDVAAQTVSVDSWLMPEEFFVAFEDEDYDVRILEA